jgi:hypothetical protein
MRWPNHANRSLTLARGNKALRETLGQEFMLALGAGRWTAIRMLTANMGSGETLTREWKQAAEAAAEACCVVAGLL